MKSSISAGHRNMIRLFRLCGMLALLFLTTQDIFAQCTNGRSYPCRTSDAVYQIHGTLCSEIDRLSSVGYSVIEKLPVGSPVSGLNMEAYVMIKSPLYDRLAAIEVQNKNMRAEVEALVKSRIDELKIDINERVIEALGKVPSLALTPEMAADIRKEVDKAIQAKLAETNATPKP